MRDSVRPLLRSLRDPQIISEESLENEIVHPVLCWRRVAALFHNNFTGNKAMLDLAGSVLCDIPEEVFHKVVESLPFFILADKLGYATRMKSPLDMTLYVFPPEILSVSFLAGRGVVVHEISHTFQNHPDLAIGERDFATMERQADALAVEWGFGEEIMAIRKYLEERRTNDG